MTQDKYKEIEDRQIRWQREVMQNHCTICWNHNGWARCDSCGFWGFVAPEPKGLINANDR